MKKRIIFLALVSLMVSGISYGCPDFSGHYVGTVQKSGQQVDILLEQQSCEQGKMTVITADVPAQAWDIIFDGVSRLMYTEKGIKIFVSFQWDKDRIITKFQPKLGMMTGSGNGSYSLDEEGNLVEEATINFLGQSSHRQGRYLRQENLY
ncbi:MAG: hypothetical protein WCG27_08575 [Pseudomonadota bacterium]